MNIPAEQKVEAWFTQDIETSAGPDFFFGLPGLIMKVIVDDGTTVYKVLALDTQAKTTVKAPTTGKKITREEYRKLMQQQMQGMRPPGGGGGQRMMIINQ
jgi:GLPGLI family protein